jgi:transcriptional regulator with XRE-family HTH domain
LFHIVNRQNKTGPGSTCQQAQTFDMMGGRSKHFYGEEDRTMADIKVNRARLKTLMLKREVSDGDVGALTGLARTTIYNLRVGNRDTTSERTLFAIAQALDTTVDYLSSEGEPEDDGRRVAVMLDEPGRKLAEVAKNLSAIRKEELIRIAETLVAMEREQSKLPLTAEAMDTLIEIAEQLRVFAGGNDPLEVLEALLNANTNAKGFVPPSQLAKGFGNQQHKN